MDDGVSFGAWLIAIMIAIYLALFTQLSTLIIVPIILALGGIVMQISMSGKLEHDPDISEGEGSNILKWTVVAMLSMTVASFTIPQLFLPPTNFSVTTLDSVLYSQLYAISEERFFRGGINTFLLWKFQNPVLCSVLGGGIFAVYHFAAYGTSDMLLAIVFTAGLVLSYVTYRTNRLTSATLAHSANNLMASVFRIVQAGGAVA